MSTATLLSYVRTTLLVMVAILSARCGGGGGEDASIPPPTVTAIDPISVTQGTVGTILTLTGTDFLPDGTVEFGTGITVTGTSFVSPTSFEVLVDTDHDAVLGPQDVVYTNPGWSGGAEATLAGGLQVNAPFPTVTSITPTSVTQGATGVTIALTGTNFRSGGAVAFGTGISVTGTSLVSATSLQVTVDAGLLTATLGAHDVVYTQPVEGGGATGTLSSGLQVDAPTPTVTSISPTSVTQGATGVTITLTGTSFRSGGAVTFGTGISVTGTSLVSATSLQATVDVDLATAAMGAHDVVYTQPTAGGGATGTLSSGLQVDAPTPTVTSISPTSVTQGATGVTITLTGTNFRSGGTVAFGTGISVTGTSLVSTTSFQATVDAGLLTATLGAHNVVYTQPAAGGGATGTLSSGLQVNAPTPTVTSISPTTVTQGATGVTITLTGTNFRSGGTVAFGTGISVTGTSLVSTTSFQATVDAGLLTATLGAHDVVYTQPAAGGGATGTLSSGLQVNAPTPTVTSISPTSVAQGATGVTITLTGTNFRLGGTVTFGTGISVTGTSLVSATSLQATVTADLVNATLGSHDVVITQPAAGGGWSGTLSNGLQVDAPTPTITSVSPTTVTQGATGVTITLTGTNFRSGGVITTTGLTLGSTTVVSATQATVLVTVSSTASAGARNVTYTHPAVGGGASVTSPNGLTVNYPNPTISSVSPTGVSRGSSGVGVTLTGTGFRSDGGVSLSGTDPTVVGFTRNSDTSCTIQVTTGSTATLGTRNVTYTQSASGGGASATLTNGLNVGVAPTLTSITSSTWRPGDTRLLASIVGTNYNTGTAVSVSGSGVTIHSTTVVSTTALTIQLSVASNAAIGARNLTITPGSGGGSPASFTAAVTIVPADPTVTAFSHPDISAGASVSATIRGTNFRASDILSASGSGVSFSSKSVVNSTTITATVSVASGASTGARSLTVSHAATEGGRAGTLAGAFTIVSGTPTVSAIVPAVVGRTGSTGPTRRVPVTVTGTRFASGAVLSVSKTSGSGLSVVSGSTSVVNSTTLVATVSIAGTSTTGTWNVVVTNPNASSGTGSNLLTVNGATTLAVNNVAPSSGSSTGGERVTIYGSGFLAGAVVDFGTVRAAGTLVIDRNTLVTIVPAPTATSASAATVVGAKVTNPSGTPGNVTLANAYAYALDDGGPVVTGTVPANGSSGNPANLRTWIFVLNENVRSSSLSSTTGFDWFGYPTNDVSSARVGSVGSGAGRRLVAVHRNVSPASLTSSSYRVNIPTSVTDLAGNALNPTPYSGTVFQASFSVSTTTDTTAPSLTSITPASSATGVGRGTPVTVVFSEPVDPTTVTASYVTFKQGTTVIAASRSLATDAKTLVIVPEKSLTASTTYTTNVTAGVKDLCGNSFSNTSYTFTTGGSDSTSPTIDSVVLEKIPSNLDGSGTYLNRSGASTAFDLYLPRYGWLVEVTFSDTGSGIDETTFSALANRAVAGTSSGSQLASNFTVTSSRATWRIPATGFATGDNATLSFTVRDKSANSATTKTVTFDVADITSTATGHSGSGGRTGGDLDPFGTRQTWVLRSDIDAYTATYTTPSNSQQGVTTTVSPNGILDIDESLRVAGLNSGSMTTSAAGCVNGTSVGTNAIIRRLFLERTRALLRVRYGIAEDGTRGPDSANIEFLLQGEQGLLTSLPTYRTSNSWSTTAAFSEMSIGGTRGAEANATAIGGALGSAYIDGRNTRQEANLNYGGTSITGIYLLSMLKARVNDSAGSIFRTRVSSKFVTVYGGTPIGTGTLDHVVLAGTFVRSSGTTAQRARYDDILDATELIANYTACTTAHEIGHSTGLVMNKVVSGTPGDGAPKTGLFGYAHYSNTFTEATSAWPNTSWHLNSLGNDIMGPGSYFVDDVATGTNMQSFSPFNRAYLLRRLIYDEGK